MSDLILADLTIRRGAILARLSGSSQPPRVAVVLEGTALAVAEVTADGPDWHMSAPLPMDVLSDGARALALVDQDRDEVLATLPVSLGEAYADDLRAEVEMLRAELDLLKKAVRRQNRSDS